LKSLVGKLSATSETSKIWLFTGHKVGISTYPENISQFTKVHHHHDHEQTITPLRRRIEPPLPTFHQKKPPKKRIKL
jgi:hypothetical protein